MSDKRRAVMIVLSNPVDDRDDEYNQWYDDVHLPDVLSVPGFVAATRYRASSAILPGRPGPSHRYVALYEIEADDIQETLDALRAGSGDRVMSDAFDRSTSVSMVFEPISSLRLDESGPI